MREYVHLTPEEAKFIVDLVNKVYDAIEHSPDLDAAIAALTRRAYERYLKVWHWSDEDAKQLADTIVGGIKGGYMKGNPEGRSIHRRWLDRWHERSAEANESFGCLFCRYYVKLRGDLGFDWGVCTNAESKYDGLLMFEHWGCAQFEMKPSE